MFIGESGTGDFDAHASNEHTKLVKKEKCEIPVINIRWYLLRLKEVHDVGSVLSYQCRIFFHFKSRYV